MLLVSFELGQSSPFFVSGCWQFSRFQVSHFVGCPPFWHAVSRASVTLAGTPWKWCRVLVCLVTALEVVVSTIMYPQDSHILISRTCEYFTSPGKRDFTNVIKWRILRWGDYFGISRWAPCNHRSPCQRKMEAGEAGQEMWRRKQRLEWCRTLNQGMWASSRCWKRQWWSSYSLRPPERMQLLTPSC